MQLPSPLQAKCLDIARTMIGVPWRHRGISRTGVDCIGLVLFCAREAGLLSKELTVPSYSTHPRPSVLMAELERIATRKVDMMPGGVVFFYRHDLVHLAIYAGNNHLIHADRSHGAVVEIPWTKPWSSYPSNYWEFK